MNVFEAIFQAIIQGLTEFLPVSSSGHLSLAQHFLGINGESAVLYSVILHLGTLVAVFIAFRKLIGELVIEAGKLIKDAFTGKLFFKKETTSPNRWFIYMLFISLVPLLFFYFLSDFYTGIASDNDIIAEGIFFIITGALLFFADKVVRGHKKKKGITAKDALIVGIVQGIAPLPGISRSGSTISTALFCGFDIKTAISFSFIMGIPPILAGSALELKDALGAGSIDIPFWILLIGFVVATIVGFLAIKMVAWLATSNKFRIFAYYTFILGGITIILGIVEAITKTPIISLFK